MNFIKKYKHGFVILIYGIIYMYFFHLLETRQIYSYHLIHTAIDDRIPFCEYFIVPYLLWFPYQVLAIAYFIFSDGQKKEYYQLTKNLCMGMTIFLIVSWLYPNGQMLRPETFARDNIFTQAVAILYTADTPTNILPSIHVFNSVAIHMAILNCKQLIRHRWIRSASCILTVSIVLSTMFLKQHSVVDVTLGLAMSYAGYLLFYRFDLSSLRKQKTALHYSKE